MKKSKILGLLTCLILLWSIFISTIKVYAATATVGFSGDSTVNVGSNITITMYISEVDGANGGIASVGGNLSFDSEYLEYVSGTGTTTPYIFQINPSANYIIAGLDTSLANGITGSNQTNVFTFVFKAKKLGTTTITLTNARLTDTNDRVTTTVNEKTINIINSLPSTKSSDATLKSLEAIGYTLSPSFSPSITSYTIKVPNNINSLNLTGNTNDSKAIVNGLGNITLQGETTTANIKVTAEDGTTKTYTITINKEITKSSDATLKSLEVSGYTLSPSFSSDTTSYTVKVPLTASTVKISGTANDNNAKVSGLGDINLSTDKTIASVKVTAENGTTKTYTVNIIKENVQTENKDSDATLKKLDVSGYTLTPAFKKNINTYSMAVKNSIQSLNITAIPNSDKATVVINGNKNWKVGVNKVTIKVIAEDNTTNTYIVNVTRGDKDNSSSNIKKSSDNYLKSLTIYSSHEIIPKFNKDTSNYNVNVPYEVDKLDLIYEANDSKAKVKVKGNENFKVGEVSTVEIEVTAEDGGSRIYSLNVMRSSQKSNNNLKKLLVAGKTLKPTFEPNILEYEVKVENKIDKLDIIAIPEVDTSKVEIIGNENLEEGHNNILIRVTDKEGFEKYYILDVIKEAANTILGLSIVQFWSISGILIFLLLALLLLLFLLRRKRDSEKSEFENTKTLSPIIEIKPEFNFGSKNTSDDDLVHGNFTQGNSKLIGDSFSDDYIPYNPYDQTVTKREIIDAIHEAAKTKDASKLKLLLDQDELNQRKKEIRKKEEERKRRMGQELNDWSE